MSIRATLGLLGQAIGRVRFEYADLAKYQADKDSLVTFDAIIFCDMVTSDRVKVTKAIQSLPGVPGLPPGHSIAVGAPPGSAYLYAEVSATSAESAGQILLQLLRRGLEAADVTVDNLSIELEKR